MINRNKLLLLVIALGLIADSAFASDAPHFNPKDIETIMWIDDNGGGGCAGPGMIGWSYDTGTERYYAARLDCFSGTYSWGSPMRFCPPENVALGFLAPNCVFEWDCVLVLICSTEAGAYAVRSRCSGERFRDWTEAENPRDEWYYLVNGPGVKFTFHPEVAPCRWGWCGGTGFHSADHVALLTDGFAFDDGTRNEGLWDVPFSRVTGPGPLNPDDWMVAYAKDGSIVTRFGMPVIDYPDGIPLRLTNPLVDKPVYGSMLGLCSTIGLGALGIGFALHDLFCKPKVAKGR